MKVYSARKLMMILAVTFTLFGVLISIMGLILFSFLKGWLPNLDVRVFAFTEIIIGLVLLLIGIICIRNYRLVNVP